MKIWSWPPSWGQLSAFFPRSEEPVQPSTIPRSVGSGKHAEEEKSERIENLYWTWCLHGHW